MQSSPVLPAWQMQAQQKSATSNSNSEAGQNKAANLTNGFHSSKKFDLEESDGENNVEEVPGNDGAEV